ncbi:MAG: hypothetical protein D6826_04485 [Alphaproteobacteria bacterium]|nr:MAG: hypothetical protein D6826_04485 [Alphaproteobacteria bacterium]
MNTRKILIRSITYVLFGLLIVSFAIWGIGDIFRGLGQSGAVAEVGDQRIEQQDFARALSREANRLSARLGQRVDIDQLRALGIVDQVLGQMIARALFDQKAADLGLIVTEEQILRRIQREPAFRNERGEFDRSRFIQVLRQSNLSEQEYLDAVRRDILRQQIVDAISGGVAAPRTLAEALYRYRAEERIGEVMIIPNSSITDLPQPDEDSLRAFHKEFANNFMAPERRTVTYISLRAEDLVAETGVSEDEIVAAFETRKEQLGTPERRQIRQIIFNDEETARQAYGRLKEGITFEAVAQDYTGQPPVDLGLVTREDLPADLGAAAFALATGQFSDPVQSPLGWHILHVAEIEPAKEATLAEVREDLRRDLALSRAVDSLVSIANQLDDELAAGASLEEAAARLNLSVRKIEGLDRQGNGPDGKAVEGLPGDNFLEIAFTTEPGQESLLTETSDGGFFILRVDGVTPAQVRPLAEVRDQVVELWRNAQRAQRAREKAEALAARARQGVALADLAREGGYEIKKTAPLTRFERDPAKALSPLLPAKLFELSLGQVAAVSGQDAHFVVRLIDVKPADPAANETEVAALRTGLATAMRSDLIEQYIATLRNEYGAEVNRRLVEDVLATF